MTKPFFYEGRILPDGFQFPADYIGVAIADECSKIEPWKLLQNDMALSLFYYSSMLLKFPANPLIPFAIIQDKSGFYNDGWVVLACFDGSAREDPRVLIYDYSTPKATPWHNLSYAGFSEWLSAAKEESAGYKADGADEKC